MNERNVGYIDFMGVYENLDLLLNLKTRTASHTKLVYIAVHPTHVIVLSACVGLAVIVIYFMYIILLFMFKNLDITLQFSETKRNQQSCHNIC